MARVTDEFAAAVAEAGRTAGEFVAGRPHAYRELWAHGGDTTIFGGWGDHEHGWDGWDRGWTGQPHSSRPAGAPSRR